MFKMGSNPRPKIIIPRSIWEYILEIIGIAAVIIMFALLLKYWPQLPAEIPTHFDYKGQPDGWGSKSTIVFLPGMGALLYIVMAIVSRYPHTFNYPVRITEENAAIQYLLGRILINWLRTIIVIMFICIEWGTIRVALGSSSGLTEWFLIITLLMVFVPLIIYFWLAILFRN